jgi:hypothetical protein
MTLNGSAQVGTLVDSGQRAEERDNSIPHLDRDCVGSHFGGDAQRGANSG